MIVKSKFKINQNFIAGSKLKIASTDKFRRENNYLIILFSTGRRYLSKLSSHPACFCKRQEYYCILLEGERYHKLFFSSFTPHKLKCN